MHRTARTFQTTLALLFVLGTLSCRARVASEPAEVSSDPPPPEAPVVAILSEDGRLDPDARSGTDAPNPIRILTMGPRGTGNSGSQIYVRFNQPMADQTLKITTSPPTVRGRGELVDAFNYSYSINGRFPEATKFDVRMHGTVMSKSGYLQPVDESWTFSTARPKASLEFNDYYGYDEEEGKLPLVEWDEAIDIQLTSGVDKAKLRKALTVTTRDKLDAKKTSTPFRLIDITEKQGKPGRSWRIRPPSHWPAGAIVDVELAGGLVTRAGPLPTLEAQRLEFRVSPGITATLQCNDEFEGGCGPSSFSINFDRGVPERLLKKIRITPKPVDFEMSVYDGGEDSYYSYVSIWGDLKVGTRYRVQLPKGLRAYGGQPLAGKRVITVPVVPPSPSAVVTSSGTLMASHRGSFGVETRYYRRLNLEVDPLSDAELAEVLLQSKPTWFRTPTKNTSQQVKLSPSGPFAWDSRAFEIAKLLGKTKGAALVRVNPEKLMRSAPGKKRAKPSTRLFQLTDLSIVAGDSPAGSFIWVNELQNAKAVPGATAQVWTRTPSGFEAGETYGPSDKNGLIELEAGQRLPNSSVLIVTAAGGDRVGLPLTEDNRNGYRRWRWNSEGEPQVHPIGDLMTDRPLYRPGERVRVLGWAANATLQTESRLAALPPQKVLVVIEDSNGLEVARRTVRSKDYGKYWATLELPADVTLGRFRVTVTIDEKEFTTRFKVREFQTPSFDVTAHTSAGDVQHGQKVALSAQANYLHGMPVPIEESRQVTQCSTGHYRPPGSDEALLASPERTTSWTRLGKSPIPRGAASDKGRLRFVLDTGLLPVAVSNGCNTSIAVQDAAHEEMGASASFTVHPSRYILTRDAPSYEKAGEPFEFTVEAVDYQGKRVVSEKITAAIHVSDDDGKVGARLDKCSGVATEARAFKCRYTPKKSGRYVVKMTTNVDGAKVETTRHFRVWQPRKTPRGKTPDPKFHFSLEADPTVADPGDVVQLVMESPREKARALLVRSQGGIRHVETVAFTEHRLRQDVRVQPAWTPRQYFTLLEPKPRTRSYLPRLDRTRTEFGIKVAARKLEVTLDTPESVGPSEGVSVSVSVHDSTGKGIQSHVSLWAVDEAILALEPWSFPDLVETFSIDYGSLATFIEDFSSVRWEYHPRGDPLLGGYGTGSGSGFGSGHGSAAGGSLGRVAVTTTPVRRRLEATPIFIGDVKTDANGNATVRGRMPDNLTTFRVAAVASAALPGETALARFGVGEGRIRVTSDLSVRPILPGVLRPGDRSELSAMVNNMTSKSGSVSVQFELVDAAGVLTSASDTTVRKVMSGPQILVPLAVEALAPGEALVRATVAFTPDDGSAVHRDAMEIPLLVAPERTLLQSAALYGSIADERDIAIDIDRPFDIARGSAEVQVSTYTSLLGGYQDNVDDLVQYPYGCVEQTSSRLIPLLALGDLAKTYPLGIKDVDAYVGAAVTRLASMQTGSGGFGYWPGAVRAHFYGTAYATWVLTLADKAGHGVPERVLERARKYLLQEIEIWATDEHASTRDDARMAMAIHAVSAGPGASEAAMARMLERFDNLPNFAKALIVLASAERDRDAEVTMSLLEKLREDIDERDEYARTRASKTRYAWFFDSPARSDAMMLLAFATVRPTDPLTVKLARGIARSRDAGRLRNTQENAYALVAMATYARVAETEEPDMFVQGWLNQARIVNTKHRGRTFDVQDAAAPLPLQGDDPRFTLSKRGDGRMYYRVGMKWSPATMPTEPKASGFVISKRMWTPTGEVLTNGSVTAGAVVKLVVTVTNDIDRDYVAAEIPIPAGLTPVDTSIGKGRAAMVGGGKAGWSNHRELRPDRVVLFADSLHAGTHTEVIYLRATTPGRYRVPPARVESMYYPEIHGHTAGGIVTVKR